MGHDCLLHVPGTLRIPTQSNSGFRVFHSASTNTSKGALRGFSKATATQHKPFQLDYTEQITHTLVVRKVSIVGVENTVAARPSILARTEMEDKHGH